MKCRSCGYAVKQSFCDLGMSPLANSLLLEQQLNEPEVFYPLHAQICSNCLLVQLDDFESPTAIFDEYLYFSSYSRSWLDHASAYSHDVIARFELDSSSHVVEIASNDGYLLRNFVAADIPCLGIEPAANIAAVAREQGVNTITAYFGTEMATRLSTAGVRADLLIGNNVLAHVPTLNDFVEGMSTVLASEGVLTLEFPHLLRLISDVQFDTIYHEHFSYFSLYTVTSLLGRHGLRIFDVEELSTHGGSLRVFACHKAGFDHKTTSRVGQVLMKEEQAGLQCLDGHLDFIKGVRRVKRKLVAFLIDVRERGQSVVAYGAPAKGNTLLNYCGVRDDLLDYAVDLSPHKQGRFLPGTHLPVYQPERITETRPDYLLILPWNLREEIVHEMSFIREWGGQFVVPIPELTVVS